MDRVFSPSMAKRTCHKSKGEKRIHTVRTEKKRLVRYLLRLLYLSCVSDGFRNDFYSRGNGFKFLTHVESKTSQFEIVKSLASFNTQFNAKESFKLVLIVKVKNTW